jgi:GTPase SAR1 family protein
MITGPWGVGKTYLVKKFLKDHLEDNTYVYVSLYGLTTREELDTAVFQACFPNVMWNKVELVGRIGKAALKYVGINPEVKISDVSRPHRELYVFDDLERCEMPIAQALGYINELVEHERRKVVIIGNEQEIKDEEQETYLLRREKLIGMTFEVQSEFDEAFSSFVKVIGDFLARSLVETKKAHVSDVYRRSGLNNLRILQQSLWDFSRFFGVLDQHHRDKDEAVTLLLRSFFALSFEFKAGRLRQEDLTGC